MLAKDDGIMKLRGRKLSYQQEGLAAIPCIPMLHPAYLLRRPEDKSKAWDDLRTIATRAKDGKLQPHEYQGGTASLSNMGMYGIKQFDAVINPPQAMIMAIGAGEKRPFVIDDSLQIATVMSATGSFDHRAIDGADAAQLMKAFRDLCEKPLGLVA